MYRLNSGFLILYFNLLSIIEVSHTMLKIRLISDPALWWVHLALYEIDTSP